MWNYVCKFIDGGGGGVRLNTFAASIDRGNLSIVEVAEDSFITSVPSSETWRSGTLSGTIRCFDLLVTGKCTTYSDKVKIEVRPASQIPNFFKKNKEGKIVFAEPQILGTVIPPKGHNSWVQFELETINGQSIKNINLSDVAKHVCLGIRKSGEDDFFDVIHAGKLASNNIDILDKNYVELIPLLSDTETNGKAGYKLVNPGDPVELTGVAIPTTGLFDFGSVYRITIKSIGEWTSQSCNLSTIKASNNDRFDNLGTIGVGVLSEQNENQLLAISDNGRLARSTDGISWFNVESNINGLNWDVGPIYGNGLWCTANTASSMELKRSIDGGLNWTNSKTKIRAKRLAFGNGTFMTISEDYYNDNGSYYSKVYMSQDAEIWNEVSSIPRDNTEFGFRIIIYGNNKWLCGTRMGNIYQSKDGIVWKHMGEISQTKKENWYGGCYANGYFYVINSVTGSVMKSATGFNWDEVTILSANCFNITCYKNRLYVFNSSGSVCNIGLPNP